MMKTNTHIFLTLLAVSIAALLIVFAAQIVGGLAPCMLCLYQRIPFIIAILLSLAGLAAAKHHAAAASLIALNVLTFCANTGLAFYHSGVERHWWKSAFEGCAVTFGNTPRSMLETIMNTKAVRCDEIPWADPVLHLSMANYNALLCAALSIALGATMFRQYRTRSTQP